MKSPSGNTIRATLGEDPEILAILAQDASPYVRARVASNPFTHPDTLVSLAQDTQDLQVQVGLANNPNTPPEILAQIAAQGYWLANARLVWNHSTPYGVWITFIVPKDIKAASFNGRVLP